VKSDKKVKKAIEKFLTAWQEKNWAKMVECIQLTWRTFHEDSAEWLRNWFGLKDLKEWKITGIKFVGEACRDIFVDIDYGRGVKRIKARVICEKDAYKPTIKGKWGVNPVSCLKEN